MKARIFQSLFVLLASATRQELARQVQFLKTENAILRARLPKRIDVTPKERNRLVRAGGRLASKAIRELVSIVAPQTFLRWIREERTSPAAKPANRENSELNPWSTIRGPLHRSGHRSGRRVRLRFWIRRAARTSRSRARVSSRSSGRFDTAASLPP